MRTTFSAHPEVKKYTKAVLIALGMVALTAVVAFAAEKGGEEGATTMDWVWRVVNFAFIFALLVWVWIKYGKPALLGRIAVIEAALTDAKAAREQALSRLSAVEAKLKDKDAELQGILKIAQANGEKEKELLVKEAEEMTADVVASARELIEAELVKAKEAIRREAALKAVELAERMVRENVKKEDQARMLQEYLEKVGR
jgi:F-type H+-transporting ATPase subunit b